mgnify:CR=1 FL=1
MKKQALFPDHYRFDDPETFKSLTRMTDDLVARYTSYPDTRTYLEGYAITGDVLKDLLVDSHILCSKDDPVIPYADMERIFRSDCLSIQAVDFGGHCGFMLGMSLNSWVDEKLVELFSDC